MSNSEADSGASPSLSSPSPASAGGANSSGGASSSGSTSSGSTSSPAADPAANDTIFGRILRGEIPCDAVYADDHCLAFRDLNPQAPVHVLVIPRQPIAQLAAAAPEDAQLLGHLLLVAAQVAQQQGLASWRTVINTGAEAGQTVFHLHLHVIGGRALGWPPG